MSFVLICGQFYDPEMILPTFILKLRELCALTACVR